MSKLPGLPKGRISRNRLICYVVLVVASLIVAVVLATMGGCSSAPPGVQSALFTAESALNATVDEAAAAKTAPWAAAEGETAEQKAARLEEALSLCLDTMTQAAKNLKAVSDYFDSGRTTPLPGEDGE